MSQRDQSEGGSQWIGCRPGRVKEIDEGLEDICCKVQSYNVKYREMLSMVDISQLALPILDGKY